MLSFEREDEQRGLDHLAALREGFICGICRNFLQDAFNIPCGHTFCEACIDRALTDKSMCPDCKNPAWQKDTRKAPQVDSTVHDWLTSCEARYQALVAKMADEKGEDGIESNFGNASEESDREDVDGNNDQKRSVSIPPAEAVEPLNEESGETGAGAKKRDVSKIATPAGGGASVEKGAVAEGCVEPEKENVQLSPQCLSTSFPDPVVASFTRRRVAISPMSQAKPSPGKRHPAALVDSALASPRESRREQATVLGKTITPLVMMERECRSMGWGTSASGKASSELEEKQLPLGSMTGSPSSRSPEKRAVRTLVARSGALGGKSGAEEAIFRFSANLPDTCDVTESPLRSSPATTTKCLIQTPPILEEDMAGGKARHILTLSSLNVQLANPLVGTGISIGGGDLEQLRPAADDVIPFAGGHDREGAGDVNKNRWQLDAPIRDPTHKPPPTVSCSRDAINDENIGIALSTCSTREGIAKNGLTSGGKNDNKEIRHASERDEKNLPGLGHKKESPVGPARAADAVDDNSDGDGCVTEFGDSFGEGSDNDSLPLFIVADGKAHEARGKSKVANSSRSQGIPSQGVGHGEAMTGMEGRVFAGGSEHGEDWGEEDDGEETCDEGGMEQDLDARSPSRRLTEATVPGNAALGNDPADALGGGEQGVDLPVGDASANGDGSKGPEQSPLYRQAGRQEKSGLGSRETTSSVTRRVTATEHDGREMEVSESPAQGIESPHTSVTGGTTGSAPISSLILASETKISDSHGHVLQRTKHPGAPALRELRVEESERQQVSRPGTKLPRSSLRQTSEAKLQENQFKDELKVRNALLQIGDTLDEVRETPSPRQTIEQAGADGCDISNAATVCLATQEHSEQDSTAETVGKGNSQGTDDQDALHIPETETVDQSLGTQEVPETASVGFQSALGDDSPRGASVEWPAPTPAAPVKGSSLSESEIPETPQLQDNVIFSASEKDGSGDADKIMSHITARAAGCEAAESLSGQSSVTLLGETADVSAQSEGRTAHALPDGLSCLERSGDAPTPEGFAGSPAARNEDGGRLNSSVSTENSPRGGGLRRSLESNFSTSDVSTHAESPEKKCKSIPPPVDRSFVDRAAGGDADHSSGIDCDGSGRASEEVAHDLAAAQDAWQAAGNTGAGDDYCEYADYFDDTGNGGEGTGRPRSIEHGSSTRRRQSREVSNPYASEACLELKHDDDPAPNAAEVPHPEGGGPIRASPATDGKTSSRWSSRHPHCRPSSATMSFGAPSRANAVVGPAVLGGANASAQIRERDRHRNSNKILGAGRRSVSERQDSMAMTGSWLSYDMGPDTSEVEALEAGFAVRRAKRKTANLTGDDGAANEDRHGDVEGMQQTPSGKKRPKGPAAKRTKDAGPTSHRRVNVEGQPMIAVLGCEEWEIERAKRLCEKLGQHRLHLALVWGVTHVVIGTKHTCDSDGGRGNRHGLVRHAIDGYHEAVLRGLWVLDFAWVEACLKERVACDDGRVALSLRAPPRDFELVGCRRRHKGCDPRRGRLARCSGKAGVFCGLTICFFGEGRSEDEKERVLRLLAIGGAKLMEDKPSRSARGSKEAFTENPFHDSESGDDVSFVDGFEGGEASDAPGKAAVLVVLPDLPEGRLSQGLAKRAIAKRKALKARAAVDRAWVLSSIEQCSPAAFDSYSVNRVLEQAATVPLNISRGNHQSGGGGAVGNGRGKSLPKCRLSLPQGKNSREELVDLDEDFGQLCAASAASDVRRSKQIVSEAEKIMNAGDRVNEQAANLQPMGLGADGFAFSRHGSKKNTPEADIEPRTGSYTTYTPYVVAQEDLCKALHKAGYINMDRKNDIKISDFWSNKVYHEIFMRSSEIAGKLAEERGCPLHVLQAEYGRHKNLQTEAAEARLSRLLEEFDLWEPPDTGGGETTNEALEVF